MGDESVETRCDKQVLLWDGQSIVRYCGSLEEGLRIQGHDGAVVTIDAGALAGLVERLRRYNPLVDGSPYHLGLSNHDLINQWMRDQSGCQPSFLSKLGHGLAFRLGYCSHPAVQMPNARRLHQVLAAERLVPNMVTSGRPRPGEFPTLSVLEAIEPFVGREVLVVDRRPFTLARLVEVRDGAPQGELIGSAVLTDLKDADMDEDFQTVPDTLGVISFTFEVFPAPGCDWEGPAMFSIAADKEMIGLSRGHLWFQGLGIAIVTAPELIEMALRVASTVQYPRKRRAGIRDVIHRRTSATVRPPSAY